MTDIRELEREIQSQRAALAFLKTDRSRRHDVSFEEKKLARLEVKYHKLLLNRRHKK